MPPKQDLLTSLQQLAATTVQPPDQYREVLLRFVDVLQKGFPDAAAAIEEAPGVLTWTLVTWPSLRPQERSLMLSFLRGGRGVQVFGESQRVFLKADDLWEYLVAFGTSPAFQETLLTYRMRNALDGTGMLKCGLINQISDDDAVVTAAASEIRLLHDAPVGSPVKVRVTPVGDTTYTRFSATRTYRFLSLVGFNVEIRPQKGIVESERKVVVTGTRLP